MTNSIAQSFHQYPEEDLLELLQDILIKCYSCFTRTQRTEIWKRLHVIYDLVFCFTNNGVIVDPSHKFCKKFKGPFANAFLTETPEELHIPQVIAQLKALITQLDNIVNKIPTTLSLERLSPFLASFQNDSVQIPGQFTSTMEPNPDENYLIDKFEPNVIVVKSARIPKRVIVMRGSNGELFHFFVENSHRKPTPYTLSLKSLEVDSDKSSSRKKPSDEKLVIPTYDPAWDSEARFSKLLLHFNVLFKKMNMQARKRHIYLPVSNFIPISPNVRLIATSEEVVPYENIYRQWCSRYAREFEDPLEYYRSQLENCNILDREDFNTKRKSVYNFIGNEIVSPTIFSEYVNEKLNEDYDSVWHFKKHFITQLSVCSLIGYLFSIEKRCLFNSAVTPKSAQIFNRNFYPQYGPEYLLIQPKFISKNGEDKENEMILEGNEDTLVNADSVAVPFLLSKNMEFFIGPTAIHGIFSTVMLASVLTLGDSDLLVQVKDRLRLYFQNDLLDWAQHCKNDKIQGDALLERIEANTNNVATKILALTPEVRADLEVESSIPINTQVVDLLNAATNPENASKIDTTLFPWF